MAMSRDEMQPQMTDALQRPTSLRLFRGTPAQQEQIFYQYLEGQALADRYTDFNTIVDTYNLENRKILTQDLETRHELNLTILTLLSHQTIASAYLQMHDELVRQNGLDESSFANFFATCVALNSVYWNDVVKSIIAGQFGEEVPVFSNFEDVINDAFRRVPEFSDPPWWLERSSSEWRLFLKQHANFRHYLVSEDNRITRKSGKEKKDARGITATNYFPEWFDFSFHAPLPPHEQVSATLTENTELLDIAFTEWHDSGEKLRATMEQSAVQLADRLHPIYRSRDIFLAENPNLASLILMLNAYERVNVKPEAMATPIREFFSHHGIPHEIIALYIEELMRLNAINSPQNLKNILDRSKATQSRYRYGEKLPRAIRYRLIPLLRILSDDELEFIQELMEEENTMEPVIWELAQLIRYRQRNGNGQKPAERKNHLVSDLQEVTQFGVQWVLQQREWAFGELKAVADAAIRASAAQPISITGRSQAIEAIEEVTLEFQESLVETQEQSRYGNLKGWKIFYATDELIDERHLVEFAGRTLEELTEEFKNFIVKEGISCSVKSSSIISALNYIAGLPKEAEQMGKRKQVKGVLYKKVPRQGVRIFYRKPPDDPHIIIFFIYQKKAMKYDLEE